MSHSAPYFTSSNSPSIPQDQEKAPSRESSYSRPISKILQLNGIAPHNEVFRRSFQQHGTDQIKDLKKGICQNFENIILGKNKTNSTENFKKDLKILSPHDLKFLADHYYSKLISEHFCRSKEFDCDVIFSLLDLRSPLVKSFRDRLESLIKHDFTNSSKKLIKDKFLETSIDSDHNDFFKNLIKSNIRQEQDLTISLASRISSPSVGLTRPLSRPQTSSSNSFEESIRKPLSYSGFSASTSSPFSPDSLSSHISQPRTPENSFVKESSKINLDKISHFIFLGKDDESSLKQYKKFAKELLDYIIECSSIDNAVSLKYRGVIDKHLLRRIEIKIAENHSHPEQEKLLQLYGTLQEKPQEAQTKSNFLLKLNPPPANQRFLVDQAKKSRANPLNRSIDRAIELFNKIATKYNVSEQLPQFETQPSLVISSPQQIALSRKSLSAKLSKYYSLKSSSGNQSI